MKYSQLNNVWKTDKRKTEVAIFEPPCVLVTPAKKDHDYTNRVT